MNQKRIQELHSLYKENLLNDIIPFWLKHSIDHECGGYLHCLDRDGSVYSTDKAIWIQCRAIWMFSTLYNTIEKKKEWLDYARHGFDFITKHAFDTDGRAFFFVTREGKPLRKRRYFFSESFAVVACAAYSQASGDERALQKAKDTYRLMIDLYRTAGSLPPKVIPSTRVMKSHAMPMILTITSQELRKVDSDPLYDDVIDNAIYQITNHFMKPELKAVLENVGPNGEIIDIPAGRLINPGHAIESAWFVMHEAIHRNDRELINRACEMIDWSLELGWDREFGGLFYFVDVAGKPPEPLEWDMKLWWTHTEVLYALLLAYHLTKNQKYSDWYEKIHEYSFAHFPDREYGEWFANLHRDGTLANRFKGSMWKGPFHVPRAMMMCMKLLEEMKGSR